MALNQWHDTGVGPLDLEAGKHYAKPMTLTVRPGTGNVQLQCYGADAQWYTPAHSDHTLSEDRVEVVERVNAPRMRILASGDAAFFAVWNG